MKKILCLMCVLVIFALPTALASPEYVEIGPYNVSFGLGDTEYEIYTDGPQQGENNNGDSYELYDVFIYPEDSNVIRVHLKDYDEFGLGLKAFELYDLWVWYWSPDVIKSKKEKQISVDGKKCTLITFVNIFDETAYLTGWTLESSEPTKDIEGDLYITGSNFVTIHSWANWDNTKQLLDTIRVERNSTKDETYTYTVDIGDAKDVEVIHVHFKSAFRSVEQDIATVNRVWQVPESDPSRLIYNSSDETTFTTGNPLKLEEGYELAIKAIDLNGDKVYVGLYKNGIAVDHAMITLGRDAR